MPKELVAVKQPKLTNEQIELVKKTVAVGVSDQELQLFLYTCARVGLDPLTKQIFCISRKKKNPDGTWGTTMSIQTGIDGYRAIAERSGTLAGIDDAVFDDETQAHPNKASVTVYRMVEGNRVPFTASARWSEYCQMKDVYDGNKKTGKQEPAGLWSKMPYLMLGKCAEALALRKAFPHDLSGVYTHEEMMQADTAPVVEAKVIEVDQQGEIIDANEGKAEAPKFGCTKCQKVISEAENGYSLKMMGAALCRSCQKAAKDEQGT